jgi:5'-3' exonuclease
MGVKGLYSYINKHCNQNGNGIRRPLSYFQNKTIIIDISIYLYKFKHLSNNIIELFDNLITYLLKFNIKVILVFDGSNITSNYKNNELEIRKKQRETNTELLEKLNSEISDLYSEYSNLQIEIEPCENEERLIELSSRATEVGIKIETLNKQKETLSKAITQVSQKERNELYEHLEITYQNKVQFLYESSEEADKVISRIARKKPGKVVVMSDDTDMFLYGSPIVAMNYDHKTQTVDVYNLKTILQCLGVNLKEFIQVCIVVGTDYLSPYHDNSPLPKISITQMFEKFNRFKKQLNYNKVTKQNNTYAHIRHETNKYYTNFLDFMCFVYWKNSKNSQRELNKKLWSIFNIFYEIHTVCIKVI